MKKITQAELNKILFEHELWLKDHRDSKKADLSGFDLSGVNLSYFKLSQVNLSRANLTQAVLCDTNLTYADLSYANFTNANLKGVDFRGAKLSYANLTGANIDYASWPVWCGSLGVKADKNIVGQLLYHAFDLLKHSGIEVTSIEDLKELANNSCVVTKHNKELI